MALADILTPSCVEVGKIKIGTINPGAQSKSGATYAAPVKLDHFWVSTLHRDGKGVLIPDAELMDSLKDCRDPDGKLRQLPVMFGSNDPNEVMTAAYVWYDGKTLAGRSDGREVVFHLDPKNGARLPHPRVEKWSDAMLGWPDPKAKNRPLFRLYCTLNVMIASPAARWGGFYRFRTTSEISSRQLYGSLMHLRKLTGGILRGLVFRMVVRPMLVTPNGQASTVHVVHVEYVNSDLKQLQTSAREQLALEQANLAAVVETERQYKALVAAQRDEEPDEEVVAEAAPDPAEQQAAEVDRLEKAIGAARTLPELREVWESAVAPDKGGILTPDQYGELAKLKDRRKANITPTSPPPPPPAPAAEQAAPAPEPEQPAAVSPPPAPPPPPPATPAAANGQPPAKAGKALVEEITRLSNDVGMSWQEVRGKFASDMESRKMQDLTADQALKVRAGLLDMLKARQLAWA